MRGTSFRVKSTVVMAVICIGMMAGRAEAQQPWTEIGNDIYNSNSGNVGIGTSAPTSELHVFSNALPAFVLESSTEARFQIRVGGVNVFLFNHDGSSGAIGTQNGSSLMLTTNAAARLTIDSNGRVGIGTTTPSELLHVNGSAYVSGTLSGNNIVAQYQDLAEWVPATHELEPGTVVVLNSERTNEVMSSSNPYDTSVAGVVSHQPGITLGEAGEGKEQIATTGRVKVKVDATRTPIRVGDLLVTSSKPGMAMRSEPLDFAGRKLHQPGTIIGKALEPLAEGEGEILVLLSMQ